LNINFKISLFAKGLATLIAGSAYLISAEASTVATNFDFTPTEITSTTPTHSIFLKCKLNENMVSKSKGAILELPNGLSSSKHDFALVTGHGLYPEADCFVSDFQGNSRKVQTKIFAKNYQAGTATDWALISFKRIKGKHIKRYSLNGYLENPSLLHNSPISFAKARGLPQNSQNCKIAVVALGTSEKSSPIFSHNCRAIPGQSGSPLTRDFNGRHHLIGLHLGHMWMLKSPVTGRPGLLNIMKPYDEDMSNEIREALSEIK